MTQQAEQTRILWSAKDDPRIPSGYGIMGKHLLPRLAAHYGADNIKIYAPVNLHSFIDTWEGMEVYPGTDPNFGENLIEQHYKRAKATFLLQGGDWLPLQHLPTLAREDRLLWVQWAPYDFWNLMDETVTGILGAAWRVVPWCEYGEKKFKEHGLKNVTAPIPLGVDTEIWRPLERDEYRPTMQVMGFTDETFNVLLLGANQNRKYLREQLEGVALFREGYPEANVRLYFHGVLEGDRDLGLDLKQLGLAEIQKRPDPYEMIMGGLPETALNRAFNAADVVLNCAYEGFGLSLIQAQAVGTPAVGLAEGPGAELIVAGALVPVGSTDNASFSKSALQKPVPEPHMVAAAMEQVYKTADYRTPSLRAVEHVRRRYSWDVIAEQWIALIEQLNEERDRLSLTLPEPSEALKARAEQMLWVTQGPVGASPPPVLTENEG